MTRCVVPAAATAIAALLAASPAGAQDLPEGSIDGHGFVLAPYNGNPRDYYGMVRMSQFQAGQWYAGAVLEFAKAPVVWRNLLADGRISDREVVLDNVLALAVSGGAAVHERVRLDLSVPLFLTTTDADGTQGPALGDLRLGSLVGVVLPDDCGGYGLGVYPYLDLPTGAAARWLGDGSVGGGVVVANSFELDKLTLSGDIGIDLRKALDVGNLNGADSLLVGLGGGYLIDDNNGLNLEARVAVPFAKNLRPGAGTPGEWMASYRHRRESGAHFGAGFGTGFTRGASAAAWRVVVGGGFGRPMREEKPKDRDGDGIFDVSDACPDEPETVNGYNDTDGCPDSLSAIAVKTTGPGGPIDGANVSLAWGDGGEERRSPTEVSGLEPGTTVRADATYGCLAGSGAADAQEQPSELVVELQPVLESKANVTVVDEKGAVVSTAVGRWLSEIDGCVDAAEWPADASGRASVTLGAGTHTLRVSADGYAPATQDHEFERGQTRDIEVVLTKVSVETREIVTFDKVYFDYDSAVIQARSHGLLDEVAKIIKENPGLGRVEVAGHTDSDGNAAYNKALSMKRAQAVRKYLIAKGIDAARLTAKGYGEEDLVVSPDKSAADKAKNRRVVFILVDRDGADGSKPIEVKPK